MYGGISELGMGPYRPWVVLTLVSSPSQAAIGRLGWYFHSVRGGIDLGEYNCRPQTVGVVDMRRKFRSGNGALSSFSVAGLKISPNGQLWPRARRPQPQPISDAASGVGVFTPCGVVSTQGISVFVPGLLEL